jgi:metallopeptidase MepB
MYEGMEDRLKINVPVLDKILDLRRQCADLLGYETWAAYVLEDRMIKSASAAAAFLDDVQQKLNPIGQEDRQNLLALKKKEHEELGIPFDDELYAWDWRYYDRKYVETSLSLDNDFIKEHFPVNVVVPAILDIYRDLLRVRLEEVPNAVVWHPGKRSYDALMSSTYFLSQTSSNMQHGSLMRQTIPASSASFISIFIPARISMVTPLYGA